MKVLLISGLTLISILTLSEDGGDTIVRHPFKADSRQDNQNRLIFFPNIKIYPELPMKFILQDKLFHGRNGAQDRE